MDKKGLKFFGVSLIALAIIAVVVAGFVIFFHRTNAPTANVILDNQNKTKLSDSTYANYAYLISSDTLSPETQQAIAGFKIQKQSNSDGSQTINLIAINPEYQNQSYTLKSGENLYFIEKSLGDDKDGTEAFLGDDHAIIVDSEDYIIQGPTQFQ